MFFLLCFFPSPVYHSPGGEGGDRTNYRECQKKRVTNCAAEKKNTGYMATFSNAATCLQHYVHAKHFKCLFCGWVGETAEEEQKMHFEREGGRNYMSVHVLLLLGGKRREKKEGTSCSIFLSPPSFFPKKGKEKGRKNANDSVARPPSPT